MVAIVVASFAVGCGPGPSAGSSIRVVGILPTTLPHREGPALVVPKELRYPGTLPDNTTVQFAIPIANGGSERLELHDVQPGCMCTRVESYPKELAPADRGEIRFRFDTSWDGPGLHGEAINFITNDPQFGEKRPPLQGDRWVFFQVEPARTTSTK